MTVLVHFSGPSYSKTAVLQPGAPAIDVGRDPEAAIHLPDNDRLISRRHVMLEWADGGAKVTVLSKVNGITTPRGEFTLGQTVLLLPGDSAQLGRFSFVIEAGGTTVAQPPAPAFAASPAADDPFQVFGGGGPAQGANSVFDDPFFRSPAPPAQSAVMAMPAALDAMSGKPTALGMPASFSGAAPGGGSEDPLAAFGGNRPPVHSSVSIDEFLGAPTRQASGLGAAHLLKPEAPDSQRRLATDHVHDFNLPLRPMPAPPASMPVMPPMPAPAPLPMAFGAGPADDPLAALDALAAPAAARAPSPLPTGNAEDPWVDFAKDWVPASPARKEKPPAIAPGSSAPINHAFDDAFSSSTSWRVEDMPLHDPLASASFQSDSLIGAAFALPDPDDPQAGNAARPAPGTSNGTALRALCRGLGIAAPPQINDRDWEKLGNSIRQIVQGLSDLMNVRAELKKEMRAADRTMLGAQENNPLKSGMELEELLQYLLFMPQGAAGYMPVNRALDESITDLRAHEFASLAAVRAAVEGSIREFDPDKLRTTLMKGKRSIATAIDNARLWDLYTAHYEQKGQHMADWLEQMFNRHFMPAYTREVDRLRRESQLPADQPPRTF